MGSVPSLEDPLEKEMVAHSSMLAWEVQWTEEPGGYVVHVVPESWTWLSDSTAMTGTLQCLSPLVWETLIDLLAALTSQDEWYMGRCWSKLWRGEGMWWTGCSVSHQEWPQLCGRQLDRLPVRLLDLSTDLYLLVRELCFKYLHCKT